MLKSDLLQTDKHSIKICFGGKISDFYVAQIIIQTRCALCGKSYKPLKLVVEKPTRKRHIYFFPNALATAKKIKELFFCQRSKTIYFLTEKN
jgi:hypothetical protein